MYSCLAGCWPIALSVSSCQVWNHKIATRRGDQLVVGGFRCFLFQRRAAAFCCTLQLFVLGSSDHRCVLNQGLCSLQQSSRVFVPVISLRGGAGVDIPSDVVRGTSSWSTPHAILRAGVSKSLSAAFPTTSRFVRRRAHSVRFSDHIGVAFWACPCFAAMWPPVACFAFKVPKLWFRLLCSISPAPV